MISIATDEMIGGTGEIATIVATGGDMMTGMITVGRAIAISVTGVVMTGHATGGGMTVPAAVQRSTAKLRRMWQPLVRRPVSAWVHVG